MKDTLHTARVDLRVEEAEKEAFEEAAAGAGLSLSSWIRQRLRKAAQEELEGRGMPIAFLRVANKKASRRV